MSDGMRLNPRPRGAGHCVYCREALGEVTGLVRCDACGVALHRACRVELTECPTLGCQGDGVEASADEWRRWNREMTLRRGQDARSPGSSVLELLNPGQLLAAALALVLLVSAWVYGLIMKPGPPSPTRATEAELQRELATEAARRAERLRQAPLRMVQRQTATQLRELQAQANEVRRLARSEHGALGSARAFLAALGRGDATAARRFLPAETPLPAQLGGLRWSLATDPRWRKQRDGHTRVLVRVFRDDASAPSGASTLELTVEPKRAGGWSIVEINQPTPVPPEALPESLELPR